jgi:hypothetical protein
MGPLALLGALFWPAALVAVAVLAYRFGFAVLRDLQAARLTSSAEAALRADIASLRQGLADHDVALKAIRNQGALAPRSGRGITGV